MLGSTPAPQSYLIYAIERLTDGKTYVGLTARSLADRVRAHIQDSMRPERNASGGSLGAAIRQTILSRRDFNEYFEARVLADGLDVDEARRAEVYWIERLETYAPKGFNILPGGKSVGGPANAQPMTLAHPTRGEVRFPSLWQAIEFRNRESRPAKPLLHATVYARMMCGWSLEQALGYEPHEDERAVRHPYFHEGLVLRRLRHASEATGVPIDTLRSRLHRAAMAGVPGHDIAIDRRTLGHKGEPIHLPDPGAPNGERVLDPRSFAERAGVPQSTITYRWHQLRLRGLDPNELPGDTLAELGRPHGEIQS